MAALLDRDKRTSKSHAPRGRARFAREPRRVVVVLKGASTYIADPDGGLWTHEHGNIGLAVSGSGDVLAGVIGGLLARGAAARRPPCGASRCTRAPASAWSRSMVRWADCRASFPITFRR